jgi:iron complex outermembrane receptor protein
MNRLCSPQAVAWAAATLCALMASAHAQPTADDTSAETLPAVRITGTSLRRIDAETALPVIVLRRADIERSGARTTTELLQQLPVMQGQALTSSVVGTDSKGYASVSIHDLGDQYTLVLLNGQRMAPFGGQLASGALSSVDINTIPLVMVERIEVLTDGASAIYGADALGGVVNIITRRDGDANEATIGWTLPKGGAREWRASALKSVGSLEEKGQNLSLSASIMHRSALPASSRDYARNALISFSQGGQRYRFFDKQEYTAPGNVYAASPAHNFSPYLQSNGTCPPGQYSEQGECLYNYAADLDLVAEQRQHSVMASYTKLVGPDGKVQFDALWSRSQVGSHLAPMPVLTATDTDFVFYRLTDLGRRSFKDTSTLSDLALRLEGRTNGWQWQSGLKYSSNEQVSDIGNSIGSNAALYLAVDGQFNPFALPGQQSAAGMAALQRQAYNGNWMGGRSTLQAWQWQGSRDVMTLPGGDMKWSIGGDVRHERLTFQPSLFAQGLLSDPAAGVLATANDGDLRAFDYFALVPSTASRTSWGVFSELLAPVTTKLDLGAALREDHDDMAGQALTGKLNARWKATPTLLWRASMGTGFKTPSLNQYYAPRQSFDQTASSYACTAALQAKAAELGAAPCTDKQTYPWIYSGNNQLKPERSIQGSLGMKIEPIAGHMLGIDVWAVHIHDSIGAVDEGTVFANPAAFPGAWTTVVQNGDTKLAYYGQSLNFGTLMSSGVDVSGHVRRGSPLGLLDSSLLVSTILREDRQTYPGGPWASGIGDGQNGGATIKWRASWRTSLIHAGCTNSLTWRYQSGYLDKAVTVDVLDANGQVSGDTAQVRLRVPGQLLWDWQTSWQVDAAWQLTAGVVNIFNTKPPLVISQGGPGQGQQLGYDNRYFDARGRMLTLEAKLSF